MISANTLYRTKDLKAIGIGFEELRAARLSGIVVPRLISRQYWYLGSELIEWSETRKQSTGGSSTDQAPACITPPDDISQAGASLGQEA